MGKFQIDSLFAEEKDNQETQCNHVIQVAFESAADAEFDYLVPDELWPIKPGQQGFGLSMIVVKSKLTRNKIKKGERYEH